MSDFLRKKLFKRFMVSLALWGAIAMATIFVIGWTRDIGSDDMVFKSYKDYPQQLKAASEVLQSFESAASTGDVAATTAFFDEGIRKNYSSLFAKGRNKMKLLAGAVKNAQMVQLSAPEAESSGYPRYAEFEVKYNGLTFHVRMVKRSGKWMIETI